MMRKLYRDTEHYSGFGQERILVGEKIRSRLNPL
jgi:hypothetical protein